VGAAAMVGIEGGPWAAIFRWTWHRRNDMSTGQIGKWLNR